MQHTYFARSPNGTRFSRRRKSDKSDFSMLTSVELAGAKRRKGVSRAKEAMLAAVQHILAQRVEFWPLSDRSIHYALLNDPPLRHAGKPDSVYANDRASYHDLTDLLTRAWRNVQRNPQAEPARALRTQGP